MELQTADARYEKVWHQFLSELEQQPRLRLAAYLRSVQVKQRGFEKWLYGRGYSVHDAKKRVLKFRNESDALRETLGQIHVSRTESLEDSTLKWRNNPSLYPIQRTRCTPCECIRFFIKQGDRYRVTLF